jgi:hypothetical protein
MHHAVSRTWRFVTCTAALCVMVWPQAHSATNLVRNGSFEIVGPAVLDQGYLPTEFLQAGNIEPGADIYSNDGSFGLTPGDFGNFFGVNAQDGFRYAAGADFGSFGSVEAIGQALTTPLAAGSRYDFSGWITDSFRAGTVRGGFKLMLSPTATFNDAGAVTLGSTGVTSGLGGWQYEALSFTAPSNAASLGYLVLAPFSVSDREAYIGIDNVSITAVPEPAAWALIALGLCAVFGAGSMRGRVTAMRMA